MSEASVVGCYLRAIFVRRYRGMRTLVLTAALVLAANTAHAADFDVTVGASKTLLWQWSATAFFDANGDTREWHGIHWQPTATAGWISRRADSNDHLDHDVFIAGAGFRLVDWWHGAFAGLSIAAVDPLTDALSSHGQFISTLGWQGDHYIVMLRHVSNGGLFGGRNLGETAVLAGVRF
jgi:hypothetical protein